MKKKPSLPVATPTEAQEQALLFRWTQYNRGKHPELALLFHIPNEGARSVVTGAHLKQQGMKKGVPDLFLPVAKGRYHGLFIEMKSKTGKPTADQKWWIDHLRLQGYCAVICYGCSQAIDVLEQYLDNASQS